MNRTFPLLYFFLCLFSLAAGLSAENGDAKGDPLALLNTKDDGYRGIWYYNQKLEGNEYVYKYSGGLGTYPANHYPFTVYAPEVNKTFFCFGGTDKEGKTLLHEAGVFDHASKTVSRPTILLDKGTTDAHDNPVISLDREGHIWIFSTSHGTKRPSWIYKSVRPYDIDEFELVSPTKEENGAAAALDNFSYIQAWNIPERGFICFFTTYDRALLEGEHKVQRTLAYMTSADGVRWSAWRPLAGMAIGHYQNSGVYRDKIIGTAFNYHPNRPDEGRVGLNWRTNLYYIESRDFGKTWQTAGGVPLTVPLRDDQISGPALVHDYEEERLNVYVMDLVYDSQGRPVIFYITSRGYRSGPADAPRIWHIARWTGDEWEIHALTESDNNYDFGSLYIGGDGVWRMIGTDGIGPQAYNTGGEVSLWTSIDEGKSWTRKKQMTVNSPRNHCYPRRPINAHPDFYAIWADGNGREPSESNIFFCDIEGNVFRLPRQFDGDAASPIDESL